VHPHSPTLQGACYVDPFAGGDRLQCVYGNGTTNIDDLTKAPAATADVGPLAEQPGFIAGGVTTGPPATLVLIAGYRENTSATLFQVLCTPKR
jgi:hypothetical protein